MGDANSRAGQGAGAPGRWELPADSLFTWPVCAQTASVSPSFVPQSLCVQISSSHNTSQVG